TGNDTIRIGRAAAGDEVITDRRTDGWAAGAGATGDVVKIRCRQSINLRQCLRGAVERRQAIGRTALVGDRDEGGPLRGGITRAAKLRPGSGCPVVVAVVDGKTGVGIGVVGNVRRPAASGAEERLLVCGPRFDRAGPAAAARPRAFAQDVA